MSSDAPLWFEAIGTSSAVVLSLGWQVTDLVRGRRSNERSQAERVTAWEIEIVPDQEPYPMIVFGISNASDQAIFEVKMNVALGQRGTFYRWLGSLGPHEAREVRIPLPAAPRSSLNTPTIMFRDSAGREWLRDGTGVLRKATQDDHLAAAQTDPGAFESFEAHPTMHLDESKPQNAVYRDRKIAR